MAISDAPMQQSGIQTNIVSLNYPNKTLVNSNFIVSMDIQYAFPSQSGIWLAGFVYDRDTGQPVGNYDSTSLIGEQELEGTFHAGVGIRAPSSPMVWHLSAIAAFGFGEGWYFENSSVWRIDFDVNVLSIAEAARITPAQILSVEAPTQVFGGDNFLVNVTIAYDVWFTLLGIRLGIRDQTTNSTVGSGVGGEGQDDLYFASTGGESKTATYSFAITAAQTSGMLESPREPGPWNLMVFLSYSERYDAYAYSAGYPTPVSSIVSSGTTDKAFQVNVVNLADYYSVSIQSLNYPSFVLPGQQFTVDLAISYKLATPVPVEVSIYSADALVGNSALTPEFISTGNGTIPVLNGNGTLSGSWTLRAPTAEVFRQGLALTGQDTMTLVITVAANVKPSAPLMMIHHEDTISIKIWNITMNEIISYVGITVLAVAILGAILLLHRRGGNKQKHVEPTAEPAPEKPARPSLSPTMYCKECGAKISRDSIFCEECGTKLVER
jgi:hypothetical protein